MMMTNPFDIRTIHSLLAAFLCLMLTGCAYTNEITRTKREIELNTDAEFDRGIVLSLGPSLFHTAGRITRYVDERDVQRAGRAVHGIRRVKAGVYPTAYIPDFEELEIPELDRFKRRGWKVALKIEDHNEVNWLLYRERRRRVRDLFVVSITDNELVLARIQGDLDELLDLALEEVENDYFFSGWIEQ